MSSIAFPKKFNISHLKTIKALTENQKITLDAFQNGAAPSNLVLSGSAGTGKTFLALYLAMEQVLNRETPYEKVVIVRTAVPTKDMGFMPGTKEEKEALFMAPYKQLFTVLFGIYETDRLWSALEMGGLVEFMTTSYIRGVTIDNAVVVVDEYQNMSYHELASCITRLGEYTKVIFAGDTKQIDLVSYKENTTHAVDHFRSIIDMMTGFTCVDFTQADSVRSGLVRDFLRCEEIYAKKV
jgi:predicted ribonuclease YlaK